MPTTRTSRPLTAFGSLAALVAAAGLAVQSSARPQPQPHTDPVYPLTNTADPASMLSDLAGVFRVELRINPHQWYGNTAMLNPDGTPASTAPLGVNQPQGGRGEGIPANNDPAAAPRDAGGNPIPGNPNQNPRATQNRGQNLGQNQGQDRSQTTGQQRGAGDEARTPGDSGVAFNSMDAALNGAVSVVGYCEKRWVLGGNILQETCVIPDLAQVVTDDMMNAAGDRRSGGVRNENGQLIDESGNVIEEDQIEIGRPSPEAFEGDRMFQGVSFLSFNERTGQFSLMSMDSRQVDSLSAVGQFVPGANRIEFALTPGTQFGTGGPYGGLANQAVQQQQVDPQQVNQQPVNQPGDPATGEGSRGTNQPADTQGRNLNQTGAQPGAQPGNQTGGNTGDTSNPNPRTTTTAPNQVNPNSTANPANARVPGASQPANPNTTTGNTGSNRLVQQRDVNSGTINQSALTPAAGAFDNVRVVLEFISPDEHRVTLYRLNPGQSGSEFFNPFLVQPGRTDPNAGPRNASDDFDDDDAVGVVPNNQTGNQTNNQTGTNQQGTTGNQQGNTTGNQQGNTTGNNQTGTNTTGSTPRTTGNAPRTSTGQPTQTVPDAPGTRPNNSDQPAPDQPATTPGAENNNNPNRTGQPVAPGTVVVEDDDNRTGVTTGNQGNQIGQPGLNQGNQFDGDLFAADSAGWVIIWQATYTRADGAEASRFRNYLQRADQLTQNMTERARQAGVGDDNGR